MSWDSLPDDIIPQIISRLNYEDIFSLNRVNNRLTTGIGGESLWRQIIDNIGGDKWITRQTKLPDLRVIYRSLKKRGDIYIFENEKYKPLSGQSDVVQISGSQYRLFYITLDGSLYYHEIVGNRYKIPTIGTVRQVSSGNFHNAYVTTDGIVYTFGSSEEGKLGLGNPDTPDLDILNPAPIEGFNNVIQVSCGECHTAFVTSQGEIYTFGNCLFGKLGIKSLENIYHPQKIEGFINVKQVSCGYNHTAFITTDGKCYTFGNNIHGQLGFASPSTYCPRLIEGIDDHIVQVSCGENRTAFITMRGNLYVFGDDIYKNLRPNIKPFKIPGFGDSTDEEKVIQVECGYLVTVFLTSRGNVYNLVRAICKDWAVIDYEARKIENLDNITQISGSSGLLAFLRSPTLST